LIFPAFFIYELGIFLFSIKNGYAAAKLVSWRFFFNHKNFKKILSRRRKIQKSRLLSDKELSLNFVGDISFQEIQNPLLKYIANPIFNFYWKIIKMIIFW